MEKWFRLSMALVLGLLLSTACGPAAQPTPGAEEASGEDAPGPDAPDPGNALEVALAYLREAYGDKAPPADLTWTEENVTPEQRVGGSTFRYRADGWDATVSFPIVAPNATIYTIELFGRDGAFYWQGQVDAQGNVTESQVNPAQDAGLANTVKLEIRKFDLEGKTESADGYVPWLVIDEPELLNQIVGALDTELAIAPRLLCIPEYTLRFHLQDGSTEDFGYSCDGVSFLRGDQAFWQGQDYQPPEAFDALLDELPATTLPTEINVTAQARLARTVEIVIMESISSEMNESPGVVEVTIGERLAITDPKAIDQVVAALDTPLVLGPRARMPVPYVLQFKLDNGSLYSLGYLPGTDAPSILRGDGNEWANQDALPPLEFEALIRDVLASAPDAIPVEVEAARDAALAFVRNRHGDRAPGAELAWAGRRTTPDGLLGAESFEYAAGDWTATVSYPVVAPEHMIYQVILQNQATGFHWQGEVTPSGEVTEINS